MYKIMMIEDDEKIRSIVADTLEKWQYEVVEATRFDQVLQEFEQTNPHLVLLDINLPVFDGYYWCQQIRSISKVPIIFLSSRNQNMDIIIAINMGGDDFIQKPFDLDILVAKISALLRRKYTYQDNESNSFSHRGLKLHVTNSSIEYNEQVMELSRNEFILLQLMMRNIGKIVSREDCEFSLFNC